MKVIETLAHDGAWMKNLAIAQVVIIPLMLIWRHFAKLYEDNKRKPEEIIAEEKIKRDAEEVQRLLQKIEGERQKILDEVDQSKKSEISQYLPKSSDRIDTLRRKYKNA